MPSVYSKNCILSGELDSYCLVCSTCLPGEDKVLAHIRGSEHNKSLKAVKCYEKYIDDFIRKVNGIYFCQLCNMTFTTAAKVGIHVIEEKHVNGKRRQLERVGTSIVFQQNILIEENAWNGLVEDTCVLCNAEFEDVATHQSEPAHVLHVVRSSVTVDDNNNIYRKVDGGYQCLTCNLIVSKNLITEHLASTEHKTARKNIETENKVKENGNDVNKNNNTKSSKDNLSSSNNVDEIFHTKPTPIKGTEKISAKHITKEVEDFAKKHGLFVNKDKDNVNCNTCSLDIPAILSRIKEHVDGKKHKVMVSKQPAFSKRDKRKIEKVNHKDFCKDLAIVETIFGQFVVINNTVCIHSLLFVGLKNCGKIVCEFCNIDITLAKMMDHLASPPHANMIHSSFVIASLENEFVRQINSTYHCGHCGLMKNDFDDMLDHLDTPEHKKRKTDHEMILQRLKHEELVRNRAFLNLLNLVQFAPPTNQLF